jgi:hypothetical protein
MRQERPYPVTAASRLLSEVEHCHIEIPGGRSKEQGSKGAREQGPYLVISDFIVFRPSRCDRKRPYHSDSTASRLLSQVKHCRARLVHVGIPGVVLLLNFALDTLQISAPAPPFLLPFCSIAIAGWGWCWGWLVWW